jgi:Tfp pilus assembly protein PilN
MITINLLAPARRRRPGPAPGTLVAVGGSAVVVAGLIVASVFLVGRVAQLHRDLDTTTRQIAALRPVAQQVEELNRTADRLRQRQAILQQLLTVQLPLSEALEAVRAVIPRDVWLTAVTTSGKTRVTFDGYTFSYRSVAQFMVELKDSQRFHNVDLASTQKDAIDEKDVVRFQIIGDLDTGHPVTSRMRSAQ